MSAKKKKKTISLGTQTKRNRKKKVIANARSSNF